MLQEEMGKNFILNGMSAMPGGVLIYRVDGNQEILFINQAVLEIFECESEEAFRELTGGTFQGMVFKEDQEVANTSIRSQIQSGSDSFDHVRYRIRTGTGKLRYIENYGRLVDDPEEGRIFYVFIVDSKIAYLTYDVDQLTGLPGMRRFLEYAGRMIELGEQDGRAEEYAIVFFNTLRFKTYNAEHGIEAGDTYLQQLTSVLQRYFSGKYMTRFSDDHFVVLTENDNLEEKIADIRELVDGLTKDRDIELKAGYCVMPREDAGNGDPVARISNACECAQVASNHIKNDPTRFVAEYTSEMGFADSLSTYVVDHIDQAIQEEWIKVYYQPVIRTLSGSLCGAEALARWIDPVKGFLNPGVFIGELENSQQIHKLDSYIIRRVCRDQQIRMEQGVACVPVSFNLSRLDFQLCDIFQVVVDACDSCHVPHDMINVEITESLMVSSQEIREEVQRFRDAGFQVYMDDFGSGYSSLNALKDYEFDELKIDMAFLSTFTEKSRKIISSVVDMAKHLGLQTLAEGVETEEQYEFLRGIGCEKIQGYYIGKPMPIREMETVVATKGIPLETPDWTPFYERVGQVNFITDKSLALLEDDGQKFHYLFMNEEYRKVLAGVGQPDIEKLEAFMNSPASFLNRMYHGVEKKPTVVGDHNDYSFRDHGCLIHITMETVACHGNYCIRLASISNIEEEAHQILRQELERNAEQSLREATARRCLDILYSEPDVSKAIRELLGTIGEYYGCVRSYIYELSEDRSVVSNTFEWCDSSVRPELEDLQNIDARNMKHWFDSFAENGRFVLHNLEELPPESEVRRQLGVRFVDNLMAVPLMNKGEVCGLMGVNNVTKHMDDTFLLRTVALFAYGEISRRAAEREELAKALHHAESINRAKSRYLYNMSRDIRTPLNAIIGLTDMAKRHREDPDKMQDCLMKVDAANHQLLQMMNHFLEVMRMENSRLETAENMDAGALTDMIRKVLTEKEVQNQEPETEQEKEKAAPAQGSVPDLKGYHILLVEDNAVNLEIAQDILSDTGATMDSAENGALAVEMLKHAPAGTYDFVLMDIEMPEMNGYEATRIIRSLSDPQLSRIPILAMTANAYEEDRRTALVAGMNAHIAKPIRVSDLFRVIRNVKKYGAYYIDSRALDRFRLDYESMGCPCGYMVYSAGEDRRILYASSTLACLFDCVSMEEFREKSQDSLRNLVDPEEFERFELEMKSQISRSVDNQGQVRLTLQTQDGKTRQLDVMSFYIYNGGEMAYYSMMADITDLKD